MIQYLVFHHFGGKGNDIFASTQNLTLEEINREHRRQWPDFPSQMNQNIYIGYNGIIFPDRFIQTRLLGEEIAANKGFNKVSVAFCIAGNFTNWGGRPVDTMTAFQKEMAQKIAIAIFENRPQDVGLKTMPDYQAAIPLKNIVPHRFLNMTECYGTGLSDDWGRNLVIPHITKKIELLQRLLQLYLQIQDTMKKARFGLGKRLLGITTPHSCIFENNRG